jgi:hypothetical protein
MLYNSDPSEPDDDSAPLPQDWPDYDWPPEEDAGPAPEPEPSHSLEW